MDIFNDQDLKDVVVYLFDGLATEPVTEFLAVYSRHDAAGDPATLNTQLGGKSANSIDAGGAHESVRRAVEIAGTNAVFTLMVQPQLKYYKDRMPIMPELLLCLGLLAAIATYMDLIIGAPEVLRKVFKGKHGRGLFEKTSSGDQKQQTTETTKPKDNKVHAFDTQENDDDCDGK